MNLDFLSSIDWHDLPVTALTIRPDRLELLVTPYSEASRNYYTVRLSLVKPSALLLQIEGHALLQDLNDLEVSTFSYSLGASGLLSGALGLLPGRAGYWKVEFQEAEWHACVVPEPAVIQP